jgi:hypothetical protein
MQYKTAVEPQLLQNDTLVSARNVGWRGRHNNLSFAAYFLRTPASVLPRLCVAAFAAGVSTALPGEAAEEPARLDCGAPMLLPVVLLPRAFAVLGPGEPPVPLMVLPFERVDPADPLAPVLPADDPADDAPEPCANAYEPAARLTPNTMPIIFMRLPGCFSLALILQIMRDNLLKTRAFLRQEMICERVS